jgi:ABC-2 type transport system permease protein
MISLIKKEINAFFSTLTGYIVIVVFLVINSLFLWIFTGDYNIMEGGYATLEPLFVISPWVFLFLVPAVTMRTFSEEKRSGTLELLMTRPLSEFQIVFAKYFAAVVLVMFSLIPTLIFFYSVYLLGSPTGNIDTGGTWGSFIGLFFLAAIYVSIGVFASAITDNPIVSFIVAVVLSFAILAGFDALASLPALGGLESFIVSCGINEHYKSMSRGVIDSRDIVYFLGVIALFLIFTKTALQSRKW